MMHHLVTDRAEMATHPKCNKRKKRQIIKITAAMALFFGTFGGFYLISQQTPSLTDFSSPFQTVFFFPKSQNQPQVSGKTHQHVIARLY